MKVCFVKLIRKLANGHNVVQSSARVSFSPITGKGISSLLSVTEITKSIQAYGFHIAALETSPTYYFT